MGILYNKTRHTEPQFILTAYSDADNGKGEDHKSISGSVITLAGGPSNGPQKSSD